jgi:hypothetical protein
MLKLHEYAPGTINLQDGSLTGTSEGSRYVLGLENYDVEGRDDHPNGSDVPKLLAKELWAPLQKYLSPKTAVTQEMLDAVNEANSNLELEKRELQARLEARVEENERLWARVRELEGKLDRFAQDSFDFVVKCRRKEEA